MLHSSRTALVLNSDCKFCTYLSFVLILQTMCYILVMLDFQWISVPTSPHCLWCTGNIASTAGWAVWIIYSCWKNYSSEFAAACNNRCKEWSYRNSTWILVGWSTCNGCVLYSQVRCYAAAAYSVSKKVAFIVYVCVCVCVCVHVHAHVYSSDISLGLQQLVLCFPCLTLKDKGTSILQNIRTADPTMCHILEDPDPW